MSQVWKTHERQTAKMLGGTRRSRGANFSQSLPDVEHSIFSIECKHRKSLPRLLRLGISQAEKYDECKLPILVLREKFKREALVVLKLKDFTSLFGQLPEPEE